MCGRFSLRLSHQEIQDLPGYPDAQVGEWIAQDDFVPRYNIAPRTNAPILRQNDSGPSNSNSEHAALVLHTMKWGLVPSWSKYEDKTLSTTNARSENLVEGGGMWGSIKGRKRCAVVCQGYFEWLTKGKDKLPHFTKHKDGRIMLMAGLYDSVILEGQKEPLWTFTIVTTSANKEFDWLHDRQPVILSTQAALDTWLDTSSQMWSAKLTSLVRPYHDLTSPLECYQVPKEVGKVGTESLTFIEPVSNRKDGIQAMFSKQKQLQSQKSPAKCTTAGKRKWSRSPSPIDLTADSNAIADRSQTSGSPAKKPKVHDQEAEHSSDISGSSQKKIINLDSSFQPSIAPKIRPTTPQKKRKPKQETPSKITAFFTRT